ncbi:MAG: response regulator [Candidatus Binatia bacterium]
MSVIIVGGQKTIAAALLALSRDKQIQVIACVSDVADIYGAITETEPTIVLIDFTAVSESHYALLTEIRRSLPKTRVIFLCDDADQTKLIDAFRYGASGYLEAKDNDVFLAKAVRAVSNGEAWVPRRFVTKIVERLTQTGS